MGYLETLVLLASLCEKAVLMGKTILRSLPKLTEREKQILVGAKDGCYLLVDFGRLAILHSQEREFGSLDQPEEAALYLDAFERLCHRGLIRHIQGNHFQLTGRGYLLAKQLRSHTG